MSVSTAVSLVHVLATLGVAWLCESGWLAQGCALLCTQPVQSLGSAALTRVLHLKLIALECDSTASVAESAQRAPPATWYLQISSVHS